MSSIFLILSSFFTVRQLARSVVSGAFLLGCLSTISILSASERTAWFSDVPLIDSVTVDAQLSFAFDSPSGRILVLLLQTQEDHKDISSSYRDTLVALGWAAHNGHYIKGDELLKLEEIKFRGRTSWRLTIIPMSASQLEIR